MFEHLDSTTLDRRLCPCGSGLRALRCCEMLAASLPDPAATRLLDAALASPDEATLLAALDLAPDHPGALRALYQRRAEHGPASAADALLRRYVGHHPNDVWARCELALRLLREAQLAAAEAQARNAVRLAPLGPLAHEVMGMVLLEQSRGHAAEHHFQRALALLGERNPILLARLAAAYHQQSRLAEARALYEEANAALPNQVEILFGWSHTEQAARDFTRAAALLDEAARAAPQNNAILVAKAELQARRGEAEAAIRTLDTIADPLPEALLARGRTLDRLGRHAEAFAAWRAGRALYVERGGRTYPADEVDAYLNRLRNFYTATRTANLPRAERAPGPQPIFILGFPRSGTTLLEQMLSAHPQISGGDELPLIHQLADAAPQLLNSPLRYPEALAELWMGDGREGLETLRDQYLRGARHYRAADPAKPWFTDKMPLNETHLGLIALLFPASPILRLIRHPLDVVLSVFSNQLTHGFDCAAKLDTAALHIARIAALIESYHTEMRLDIIEVRYEELAENPEPPLRAALARIGLDFDPRCLRFTENARYARTASHAQVTEPLYGRSRFRWRNYRAELAPVLAALMPTISRLGYSTD